MSVTYLPVAVESWEVRTTTIGRLAAPVLVTEMTAVTSSSINATVVGLRDTSTASRGASVEEVWEGGRGGEGGERREGEGRGGEGGRDEGREGEGKGERKGERRGREGGEGRERGREKKGRDRGSEKVNGRMEQGIIILFLGHYLAKYISLHHFTVKMATVLLTIDVFYEDGSSVLAKGNTNWRLAKLQSYEE